MSSIWRLAPSEGSISDWERDRRMKSSLHRLVSAHGLNTVKDRIYYTDVPLETAPVKARLLLHLL